MPKVCHAAVFRREGICGKRNLSRPSDPPSILLGGGGDVWRISASDRARREVPQDVDFDWTVKGSETYTCRPTFLCIA